jgi:hypothetical protein
MKSSKSIHFLALTQPPVHNISPSPIEVELVDAPMEDSDDEDSDDSSYEPSYDGDDIEWEADPDGEETWG